MKKLLTILTLILIVGCGSNDNSKLTSQEIIEGVVSKTFSGTKGGYGRITHNPDIDIQKKNPTLLYYPNSLN